MMKSTDQLTEKSLTMVNNAPANPSEQPGYLEFSGSHLYTVLHPVEDPLARVLLVGPFAAERQFSYVPWVRWARYLAARRVEVLRYDYRGVGESTGNFEEFTFGDWIKDVEFLAGWLKRRSPNRPLVLHGLELGALLASKTFAQGTGDGMLLWSPPASANEVLRQGLVRRVIADHTSKSAAERKSVADFVKHMEAGLPLEVDGYRWSGRLWRESLQLTNSLPGDRPDATTGSSERPVRTVRLTRQAAPLVKGASLGYVVSLNPDLSELFAENLQWITNAFATSGAPK